MQYFLLKPNIKINSVDYEGKITKILTVQILIEPTVFNKYNS